MKKVIASLAALALIASAAVAEVKVSAWGRVAFVPFGYTEIADGDGFDGNSEPIKTGGSSVSTAGLSNTWNNVKSPRVLRLQVEGQNEAGTLGFKVWAQTDNTVDSNNSNSFGFGDWAGVWVKPFSFIRLDFGTFKGDALRGKIDTDTPFAGYVGGNKVDKPGFSNANNADAVFTRFSSGTLRGALIGITPIKGLYIGAAIDAAPGGKDVSLGVDFKTGADNSSFNSVFGKTASDAKTVYKTIQAGAGYTFGKVGQLRVQYLGDNNWDTGKSLNKGQRMEAAFAFTLVDGLVLDLGTKIPLVKKDGTTAINLAAGLTAGKFGLTGLIATTLPNTSNNSATPDYSAPTDPAFNKAVSDYVATTADDKFRIAIYAEPTYDFGPIILGAAVRVGIAKDDNDYGVGAYVKRDLGNGYIQCGVGADFRPDAKSFLKGDYSTINVAATKTQLYIPIIVQFAL